MFSYDGKAGTKKRPAAMFIC